MKRVVSWLCLVGLCLCLGAPVSAQQPLEPERECRLTLQYAKEGVGFAGEEVSVYRVAQANPDGTFDKIAPFAEYAVSIHNISDTQGWRRLATTLSGYVTVDGISATGTAITDAEGRVTLSGLPTGLYLVEGVIAQNESGTYTFDPFMVYLPTQQEGEYDYDVEAKPKADAFEPTPPGTEYRVMKLWEDLGKEALRPTSISVKISKDGALWKEVTLSKDNNWSYSWTDPGQSVWSVAEPNVPAGYAVFVDDKTTEFVITNQWNPNTPEEPEDPPSTGDTAPIWLYVLVLCLSGSGCVIVGVALMRGKRNEKHQ